MTSRTKGKVYVLTLVPPDQYDILSTAQKLIEMNLQSGSSVTRYGREWIIGGSYTDRSQIFRGRIGLKGGESTVEAWDEEKMDFIELGVPDANASNFAIDLARLKLAVQVRGYGMDINGLIGAFRDLLSTKENRWEIVSSNKQMTLTEWRGTIQKIISVRLSVKQPNPHYGDTPDLKALLETAEATLASLELKSENGLNVDSTFLLQSEEHIERGYGQSVYKGITLEGKESVYSSELGAEELPLEGNLDQQGYVTNESFDSILQQDTEIKQGD